MTDLTLTEALSETADRRPHMKNLHPPWRKGVSANPGGLRERGKRYQQLHGQLKAELGELNAIDAALLDRAVILLLRRPKSDADAVKLTSEARRILEKLHRHSKPETAVPLRERIAE
jgi:hypothetical protein